MPCTVRSVLQAMIKAHEIQGVLALENSFNRVGLDHVLLVRVASTAVVTAMLGGTREQVINAVSNAWIDGGALRTYRHAPNTGSRKSWAAGDATSRAVWHALVALRGEMGYPSALSAKTWGYLRCALSRQELLAAAAVRLLRDGERAVQDFLPGRVSRADRGRGGDDVCTPKSAAHLDEIERVVIETQEPGVRIIDKTGPLDNPADRDHCIQYMVAVPLIFGRLVASDYDDAVARDPRIDALRVTHAGRREQGLHARLLRSAKRFIGNAVQVFFRGGSATRRVAVDYPIGHRLRRAEGLPLLRQKFEGGVRGHFGAEQAEQNPAKYSPTAPRWRRCPSTT